MPEREENISKSKKSKDDSKKSDTGKASDSKKSGTDEASFLSSAKVPIAATGVVIAATGVVLIGAAGAATFKKTRKNHKGKWARKAAKASNPVLFAAGGQARKLKKLVPGAS